MIISKITGGLGNQMFQYAFGYFTANRLNTTLKLDITDPTLSIHSGFELKRIFDIQTAIATESEINSLLGIYKNKPIRNFLQFTKLNRLIKFRYVKEPHFKFSKEMTEIKNESYITGYWQSEKYFKEIKKDIINEFNFKLPKNHQNKKTSEIINNTNSISIHIRRNDFATNEKINNIHGLCSLEYYQLAIKHIAKHVDNPHYFIFSDDMEWVKSNLKLNYPREFIQHNKGQESYNDMRLMSECRHNITANSSFSWWGAWLNTRKNKITIAPKQWFSNNKSSIDLIPNDWIRL